ncbi:hypothetical protein [Zunongwangia profunda]|nr:hypothetical protein [Zunongwangia profunda]
MNLLSLGNYHRDDCPRQYGQYLNVNENPRADGVNAEKLDVASLG